MIQKHKIITYLTCTYTILIRRIQIWCLFQYSTTWSLAIIILSAYKTCEYDNDDDDSDGYRPTKKGKGSRSALDLGVFHKLIIHL